MVAGLLTGLIGAGGGSASSSASTGGTGGITVTGGGKATNWTVIAVVGAVVIGLVLLALYLPRRKR